MKVRRLAEIVLGAIAATAIPAPAQTSAVGQVQHVYEEFATAFRNRDAGAIMSLFVHNDSVFVFDVVGPPRQYVGWDAYLHDLQRFFGKLKPPVSFTIHDLNVTVSGDVAYAHAIEETRAQLENGRPYHIAVRVTDILRHVGNRWLFVQEHISVPIDPTSGKAELL
jgi:ketosteroid isomerase-like protein